MIGIDIAWYSYSGFRSYLTSISFVVEIPMGKTYGDVSGKTTVVTAFWDPWMVDLATSPQPPPTNRPLTPGVLLVVIGICHWNACIFWLVGLPRNLPLGSDPGVFRVVLERPRTAVHSRQSWRRQQKNGGNWKPKKILDPFFRDLPLLFSNFLYGVKSC